MDRTRWIGIAVVLVLAAGIALWWFNRPSRDCALSETGRSLVVDFQAKLKNTEAVNTRLGLSDTQVRELDAIARDFALKYDAACRDAREGRLLDSEYLCMRNNMDGALDEIRTFGLAIDAAKPVGDPAEQRAIVLDSLTKLRSAASTEYRTGCLAALDVNPKELRFTGRIPELSIKIANRGAREVTFTIDGYPACLTPTPPAGKVGAGAVVVVSVQRTLMPVPAERPLLVRVRSNLAAAQTVEVDIDAENANIWDRLEAEMEKRSLARGSAPNVNDALATIDAALPDPAATPEALRLRLASTLLLSAGATVEADKALDAAVAREPELERDSNTLLLRGIAATRRGAPGQALKYFGEARATEGGESAEVDAAAAVFSASILVNQGNDAAAGKLMSDDTARALAANPSLTALAASESCAQRTPCTDRVTNRVTRLASRVQ